MESGRGTDLMQRMRALAIHRESLSLCLHQIILACFCSLWESPHSCHLIEFIHHSVPGPQNLPHTPQGPFSFFKEKAYLPIAFS